MGKGEAGMVVQVSLPLAMKPFLKSPSYDLSAEDPMVYSDEEDFDVGFSLQRECQIFLFHLNPKKRRKPSSI